MVHDSKEVQPLYEDIFHFYNSLGMHHPYKPALDTVDDFNLDQYMCQERRDKAGPEQHVRGLCLSQLYTNLQTAKIEEQIDGTLLLRTGCKPMRRIHRAEVTGILVLSGMHGITTGSVLAHELMHAWFRMHGFRNMTLQLEEGMCQLMAHLWASAQNVKVCHLNSNFCSMQRVHCKYSHTPDHIPA
jgi:hypothetical protein